MKVTFAPGCFDNFTGTQEELDATVAKFKNMSLEEFEAAIEDTIEVDLEVLEKLFGPRNSRQ